MAIRSYYKITPHLLAFTLLILPCVALGASDAEITASENFIPLVGIPYIKGDKVATFGDYVNALYYASISIAAFLAVVRIIFAGVKYMISGLASTKQDAKKDIRSALIGLLIVVGAVLILNTINPNLKEINLFADAPVPRSGLEDTRTPPPTITPGMTYRLSAIDPNSSKFDKGAWSSSCTSNGGLYSTEAYTSGSGRGTDVGTELQCLSSDGTLPDLIKINSGVTQEGDVFTYDVQKGNKHSYPAPHSLNEVTLNEGSWNGSCIENGGKPGRSSSHTGTGESISIIIHLVCN